MISIQQLRKIDPELDNLSDEEIIQIRDALYELGQLIFEDWKKSPVSKNPVRVLRGAKRKSKIKMQ